MAVTIMAADGCKAATVAATAATMTAGQRQWMQAETNVMKAVLLVT